MRWQRRACSLKRIRAGAAILLGLVTGSAHAQLAGPSYTSDQSANGAKAYAANCASCHGESLADGEFGPPLSGRLFMQRWGGKTVDELFIKTATTMPTSAPRSLGDETYADVVAYLLQKNGTPPGMNILPANPQSLRAMQIPSYGEGPGGGLSPGMLLPPPPGPARSNPLDDITPVTDAMLTDGPPEDWLSWRRTFDAYGYSPLDSVNRKNVDNLRVAWSWALPEGPSPITPLVHDGVIFVHGYGGIIQALDAVTGELLWQYSHWLPAGVSITRKRNIAMYGELLYLPTSDSRVVALDMKTGEVEWSRQIGSLDDGYHVTGGPLVAQGMVMIGTQGRAPGGNYIVGLDAATGKEVWHFDVIARPGEPGGESWNGLLLEARNGGSVWLPGTYDPELGLAYFSPAQTYDTGPLLKRIDEPGITNDALYTNTTLALAPKTGELAWYFQHLPNDQWDLDWVFGRQLLSLPINGVNRTVVATAGKVAIYDLLAADTGRYLTSIDLGVQNLITGIDPETGHKQTDPALMPGQGQAIIVCPHAGGAKNWVPGSYVPETKTMFLPLTESCMDMTPADEDAAFLSSGVRITIRPWPDSDGNYGRLQAVNMETGKTVWIRRQRAPHVSGVLATAGGVVFAGDLNRYFAAYDQDNGAKLWRIRLNDVAHSAPISYAVDGKQYVATTVGHGAGISVDRMPLVPEIRLPSNPGATLWVFELPDN